MIVYLRVNRGIKLLNVKHHGWISSVNIKRLDQRDPQWCILGQVFKEKARTYWQSRSGYDYALHQFNLLGNNLYYGFVTPVNDQYMFYTRTLEEEWIRRINKERNR